MVEIQINVETVGCVYKYQARTGRQLRHPTVRAILYVCIRQHIVLKICREMSLFLLTYLLKYSFMLTHSAILIQLCTCYHGDKVTQLYKNKSIYFVNSVLLDNGAV